MSSTRSLLVLVPLVALTAAAPLAGPGRPTASASGSPADSAHLAAAKAKLRNLVVAEERFFADHGTYTTDVSALGMWQRFQRGQPLSDSVWVQVSYAGGRSWHGRAVRYGAGDQSCVIFVGSRADFPSQPVTDAGQIAARNEGEPICDRP